MLRTIPFRLVSVAMAASLVMGCAGSPADPPTSVDTSMKDRSEIEREVLADGQVTFAELERAALLFVDCMERELGIVGEATYRGPQGGFSFSFRDPSGRMEERVTDPAGAECEAEIDDISLAWADQQAGETSEREQYQQVVECLRAKGREVASADPDDLTRANARYPDDYRACLEEVFPTSPP